MENEQEMTPPAPAEPQAAPAPAAPPTEAQVAATPAAPAPAPAAPTVAPMPAAPAAPASPAGSSDRPASAPSDRGPRPQGQRYQSGPRPQSGGPRGRGGPGGPRGRGRRMPFPKDLSLVDYKNVDFLQRFLNESGQIKPRRKTGASAKQQRILSRAIKRARHLALLPYTGHQARG